MFIQRNFHYRENNGACLKLRNVYSVAERDASIVIGGRYGAVNELSIAYDLWKNIGVFEGSGGITESLMPIRNAFKKESKSRIIFRDDPRILVEDLCEITMQ